MNSSTITAGRISRVIATLALLVGIQASLGRLAYADTPGTATNRSGGTNQPNDGTDRPLPYVEGQVVVKFTSAAMAPTFAGGTLLYAVRSQLTHSNVYLFDLPPGTDAEEAAATLEQTSGVEYAHPNYTLASSHPVQASYPFSDLQAIGDYSNQAAAADLNLTMLHTLGTGADEVVAVIDGGIDNTHPLLHGHIVPGHDYIDGDLEAFDEPGGDASGHGTFVAGVIHLIAPDASIRPYRVMTPAGNGDGFTLAKAIERAVDDGCDVINISLVLNNRHMAVTEAVQYAQEHDVMVAAAAGNAGVEQASFPAAETPALAIAAVDSNSYLADFSEYGTHIALCAPGTNIYSSYQDHYNAWWSGTSFATPFVSGLAAVLAAINPDADASQIAAAMANTAVNVDAKQPAKTGKLGFGIIDPYAAALQVVSIETATVTPDTLEFTFPEGFFPTVLAQDSVFLSSTNAPANYTASSTTDSIPFLYVPDSVGTTDDWSVIMVDPIGTRGQYVSTITYTVEGTIEPVTVTVIQNIVPADSLDYAWANPSSFYVKANLGSEVIYSRALYLQSSHEPRNYTAEILTAGPQLTTLLDTSGETPDSVHLTVDPSIAPSTGFYTDSIYFHVDGVADPLLVPVFVEIVDSTVSTDTAWVYPDTGLTLVANDLDTLWGCVFIHSSNAPANYHIEFASPPTFVSLVDSAGTTPDSVCFVANAALTPGWYADTLLFYVDGAANNPIPQIIRLQVISGGGGGDTTFDCPMLTLGSASATSGSQIEIPLRNTSIVPPWGGFDVQIQYRPAQLSLTNVLPGDFVTGCGWEHFGVYEDSANPGIVRIVGVADLGSIAGSPSCLTPDSNAILARLQFDVIGDSSGSCQYSPIRFYWYDCGDNAVSDPSGDTLWIAGSTPYSVIDYDGTDLTGYARIGGPSGCPTGSNGVLACATFYDGVVRIDCDTIPPPPTDSAYTVPTSLYFSADPGSTALQSGGVVVISTNAPAAYVAYVSDSLGSFVSIPDSAGTTNDSLMVVVDPTGLSIGTHAAVVFISVAGISETVSLPVYLTIVGDTVVQNPPSLWLDYTTAAIGGTADICIRSLAGGRDWGGFDLLVSFDASMLTYVSTTPGAFITDCGWEHFAPTVVSADPGLIRIVSVADLSGNGTTPTCLAPDSGDVLACLQFQVLNDTALACQTAPIRFWWGDCGDNAISNPGGDSLLLAGRAAGSILDFDGADLTGTPNTGGSDSSCAWFAPVYEIVSFHNGAVAINCGSGGGDSVRVVTELENYPNPFNPQTEIAFALGTSADVRLDIYNILGRRVATLIDGPLAAGRHTITWNGRDRDGRDAASGVYFARLVVGSDVLTRKLMLLR